MTHGAQQMPSPAGDVSMAVTIPSSHAKPHLPGDPDIWVFVLGDMLIFSAYFFVACVDRGQNRQLFLESQQYLSQNLAIANTLMLLTSSLFVALSVQATRAGDFGVASRFLTLGGTCGVGFLLLKSYEWYSKLRLGLTLSTNSFFMHYYVMTGVHVVHVLIGLVFLVVLWHELNGPNTPRVKMLEVGATYWHMVDFLWFLIFALLYLMR
jgi:nitric oxide reductase NorE protein